MVVLIGTVFLMGNFFIIYQNLQRAYPLSQKFDF